LQLQLTYDRRLFYQEHGALFRLAVRIYELPPMVFATLLKVALELVPGAVMVARQTTIN